VTSLQRKSGACRISMSTPETRLAAAAWADLKV
jgi:hypothetical protein